MRKLALYFAALLAIMVLALSYSSSFMRYFTDRIFTTTNKSLKWDKFQFGDLYGLSHLKQFRISTGRMYKDERKIKDTTKVIDLWGIGDSYLGYTLLPGKADSILYGAKLKYFYFPMFETGSHAVILDKSKRNILFIECIERRFRIFFANKYYTDQYKQYLTTNFSKPVADTQPPAILKALYLANQWRIAPPTVEQNLETMLYGYTMFAPIKEFKAGIDYTLFNRTDPQVFVSPKNKLYYQESVDPIKYVSSFSRLTDAGVDSIVNNLNSIADDYKKIGFDEVVFSIAPSAVTIIEGDMHPYNKLIPRIQSHPGLKTPVLDVYTTFKAEKDPSSLYFPSDSHWNLKGFQIWVDKMNEYLRAYVASHR
jgi:hypothetical protein